MLALKIKISKKYEASTLSLMDTSTKFDRGIQNMDNPKNSNTPALLSTKSTKATHLSLTTMQQMINKLLSSKIFSVERLANELKISAYELKNLDEISYKTLAPIINLPLIKLYCRTIRV